MGNYLCIYVCIYLFSFAGTCRISAPDQELNQVKEMKAQNLNHVATMCVSPSNLSFLEAVEIKFLCNFGGILT